MSQDTVYKFRSFDRWDLVLDILVNRRMYAATFESLNDPMEGRYFYFGKAVSKELQHALYRSKLSRRILSLSKSEKKRSTLLWSYYGGGHSGIAIGIQRPKGATFEVVNVKYDSQIYIDKVAALGSPDALALKILTQKQLPWEHEGEVRVFSRESFVRVKLVELLLGCNVSGRDEELVRKLAKNLDLGIRVTKLSRDVLDEPDAVRPEHQR